MTEQQNTRPSASREIAVKKLEWEWPNEYGLVCRAVTPIGTYSVSDDEDRPSAMFCYLHLTDDGDCTRYAVKVVDDYLEPEEAQAAAQADYERRILSALDTTPGNTDPMLIARYDDELRKVQEFLEDFTSHHFEEVRRWNGPSPEDELDPVTESGMVLAFQEDAKALLDKLATPQPEAQPSVRAGAVDALAAYQQADQDGIMVLVSRQAIEECLPALRSLAQEGE